MEDVMTVYAYPTAGGKPQCEKNSAVVYTSKGGKLLTDVALLGAGGVGVAKAGTSVVKAGVSVGEKIIAKSASRITGQASKYRTVKLADTKIEWGYPINKQGLPWEDFLEPNLAEKNRLFINFKTLDFFDPITGLAINAKTINTTTSTRISSPTKISKKTKHYIDETIKFKEYTLGPDTVKAEWITERQLQVAIPKQTTTEQFEHLDRAIKYGESVDVRVFVTLVD